MTRVHRPTGCLRRPRQVLDQPRQRHGVNRMRLVYLLATVVSLYSLIRPLPPHAWLEAAVFAAASAVLIFGRLNPATRLLVGFIGSLALALGASRMPFTSLLLVSYSALFVVSFTVPTWLSPALLTGVFVGFAIRLPVSGDIRAGVMLGIAMAGLTFGILANQQKRFERERRNLYTTSGELSQSLRQVEYLAFHDALTGLPNRRLLTTRLEQSLMQAEESGHAVAVVFIDLDRFKSVNDAEGHTFGDRLLKAVAVCINRSLATGDVLGRQGGDEFILVMAPVDSGDEVRERLERIRRKMSDGVELDDQKIFATASFGAALFPHDGRTADELLRHADAALYRAKEQGRNRVAFFSPELQSAAANALYMDSALRRALAESQFSLRYQPQVDILTGRMVGLEALLRWELGTGETLMPAEFLPEAQKLGLMDAIDDWVLERAVGEVSALSWWRHQPVTLAINVSATRFDSPDFTHDLLRVLKQYGMPPERIELEITESMMSRDTEVAVSRLREIRRYGIGVAIDDFGVGYSSLNYLRHLPVTRIKIDRGFVSDLEQNDSIARAIVAVAKSLHLQVVAEGVEEKPQADVLLQLGCDVAQGFYYQEAVPAEALKLKYQPETQENPA